MRSSQPSTLSPRPERPSSAAAFETVFDAAPNPYLLLAPEDPAFTILAVNEAYLRATVRKRDELVGQALFDAFPDNPEDPDANGVRNLHASLRRVLEGRAPDRMAIQKYDIARPASEGGGFEVRYWEPLNAPVFGDDGEIEAIIHHVEDVTAAVQEKQSWHEALRRSEEQFRLIVESAVDYAIVAMDLEGRITTWNSGARRLLGYEDEEIMGQDAGVIFTPEDREAGRPQLEMQGALANGRTEDDRWHQRKDGSRFWANGLMMTLKDESGEVRGFLKIMRDRTSQLQKERALKASEQGLRIAMDAGRMAMWDLDFATDTLTGSPGLNRLLGLPPEANPTTEEIRSRYAPGEREALRKAGFEALERGEPVFEREFRYVRPDGTEAWLLLRAEIQFDDEAKPLKAVGILLDINDRKRIEIELRESEERFRLVSDSAPVMLWMGDPAGKCLYLNKAQRDFWGVAIEDVPEFDWNSTVHPDDVQTLFEPFAHGMKTQSGFSVEARYRRADGAVRILHTDARPRFGAGGEFLGMIGVNVDVTDTREAVEALQRETRLLEVMNETAATVAAELDFDRIVQQITDAGVEMTGAQFGAFFYNVLNEKGESYMLYALSGVPREAFSKFPMPRATAIFQPTFHGEGVVRSDDILADPRYGKSEPHRGMPKGHLPVRSYLAVPVTSRSGEVLGGLFFGHAKTGVFGPEHEKLVVGLAGHAAIAVDNASLFQAAERELAERRRAEAALQALNATLEQRVQQEVAERSKAEEALRQSQKMEAVGKLTGGVAHDFNNLLQVVGGNLQLLAKDIAGQERAEERVRNALSGVERGSKLASQLLAFGRRQPLAPKVVNLGRLVRGMDDLLRRALGEEVEIDTVIAGGLWNTFVDAAQVENAILNLAINARDAMNGHGRLTIEAGNGFLDDVYAAAHPGVNAGQYVVLAVTDTGFGIPADVMEHVFEPFFTTKPEGQGTGLGLSMVYGFVRQSGGHVKIYSEPDEGTTVRIYLPRTRQQEDVAIEVEVAHATGGTETVLVVEDDEAVRRTVVEMLSDLGYRVLKAKDADNALVIIESGASIDLLFTDVVMPGKLRSPELARKARERLPNLAVLFTSGYTQNAIVHGGRLDEGVELLSKPYSRETLARKVRHVLTLQSQVKARVQPAPETAATVEETKLRILLVEDEALIRMSTADMLADMGHTVMEAGNATEALAILDKEAVDVLLTDFSLPGMSGGELAKEARRQLPTVRIVFASGHDLSAASADLPEGAARLQKPYTQDALAKALDKSRRD